MNKKITVGIIGLATFAGVAAAKAYAHGGGMTLRHAQGDVQGGYGFERNATSTAAFAAQRSVMTAQRDAMDKAIEAGDYMAWKTAADTLDNGRGNFMTKVITAANFSKFVEMRKLMNQADAIGKEIGLNNGDGFGSGMMRGGGRAMMGFRHGTSTATTNQ